MISHARPALRRLLAASLSLALAACGGGGASTSTPTTPTAPNPVPSASAAPVTSGGPTTAPLSSSSTTYTLP
ncbi:MAG: hypothetical protein ABR591_09820, partial [Candidatus Velthaea sp.]